MTINKNAINDIVVTVTEKTTIDNPIYLFEFFNKETKDFSYCISENTSTQDRYDSFSIEDTNTPDPLMGQVNLTTGEYRYKIYQQTSSTNLDPDNTTPAEFTDWVEQGVLDVFGTETSPSQYEGATTNTAYGS